MFGRKKLLKRLETLERQVAELDKQVAELDKQVAVLECSHRDYYYCNSLGANIRKCKQCGKWLEIYKDAEAMRAAEIKTLEEKAESLREQIAS